MRTCLSLAATKGAVGEFRGRSCIKMKLIAPLAAAFGFAVASGSALAQTTVVTSQAEFQAATTGLLTGNFASVPTPNGGGTWGGYPAPAGLSGYPGLQGVTFNTTNPGGAVNVNTANFYGPTDLGVPYLVDSVYTGTGTDNLTITLPSAQTAFGLDFGTLFSSTTATFGLSNGFSTSVSNTSASANGGGTEFIGFLSTTPFTTITLDVPYGQSWVVQDFAYGAAPGPAPGAGLLGLVALLLGGAMVRARGLSTR